MLIVKKRQELLELFEAQYEFAQTIYDKIDRRIDYFGT
jgi:hypothetical protein